MKEYSLSLDDSGYTKDQPYVPVALRGLVKPQSLVCPIQEGISDKELLHRTFDCRLGVVPIERLVYETAQIGTTLVKRLLHEE